MNKKVKYILNKYISNYIIFDISLIIGFYLLYINIPYNYLEIPSFLLAIIGLPLMFIFRKTKKIDYLKKSENFKEVTIIFISYLILFSLLVFILKDYSLNISYLFLNIFISILTVTYLRLAIFGLSLLIIWMKGNKK